MFHYINFPSYFLRFLFIYLFPVILEFLYLLNVTFKLTVLYDNIDRKKNVMEKVKRKLPYSSSFALSLQEKKNRI